MIRTLRLKNFKCFADQLFNLSPLTLLSGLNGTGKSSVIQSLLLLRQSYQQGLLPDKGLALNGDLVRIGTAQDALFEGAQETQISFELGWEAELKLEWLFDYNPEADVMKLASGPVGEAVFQTSLFKDEFHYLSAERIGPRTSFEMSDYQVRQHGQLGTSGEFTAHYLSLFEREDIPNTLLAHPAANSEQLLAQVEAWLSEVSPGTRLSFKSHSGMDLVALQYSFTSGKMVSNLYRPTNVGFGITYILPVLVALLSAKREALVLLENPEAHLHPQGQVRIGELIAMTAASGVQVLLETHSDHVLNGIRLAVHAGKIEPSQVKLQYFKRGETNGQACSEVLSPQIDRDGRIDQWPEGFFDEFDKSLEALLAPRRADSDGNGVQ
jgi:predicted ATPase